MPAVSAEFTAYLTSSGRVNTVGRTHFLNAICAGDEPWELWCNRPTSGKVAALAVCKNGLVFVMDDGRVAAQEMFGSMQCISYIFDPTIGPPEALVAKGCVCQVSAGHKHVVFLTSNGKVWTWGSNKYGQREIPEAGDGLVYTQACAGGHHTVLLRSDGQATAVGRHWYTEMLPPEPPASDDSRTAHVGRVPGPPRDTPTGLCEVPRLEKGTWFVHVAAGDGFNTGFLRSDAWFWSVDHLQDHYKLLPFLQGVDRVVTDIAMGRYHTVMLTDDGRVNAWSFVNRGNRHGQCEVPPLETDMKYIAISAGHDQTGLLRSDGRAIVLGRNDYGQSEVPLPPSGESFVRPSTVPHVHVVQLFWVLVDEAYFDVVCRELSGVTIAAWQVPFGEDLLDPVILTVRRQLGAMTQKMSVVLPCGRLVTPMLIWGNLL